MSAPPAPGRVAAGVNNNRVTLHRCHATTRQSAVEGAKLRSHATHRELGRVPTVALVGQRRGNRRMQAHQGPIVDCRNESSAQYHTATCRTAPHRTAPHRTAPHRTAPHRTAPHRTAPQLAKPRTITKAPCSAHAHAQTPRGRGRGCAPSSTTRPPSILPSTLGNNRRMTFFPPSSSVCSDSARAHKRSNHDA
jgi:hypothetical protein